MLASNQMDVKRQLRVKYKKWMEESVTKEISLLNGSSIAKQLQSRIKPGANVSCFISKYPEINTKPVLDLLFSIGANVYIPAWHSQEMWMCHAPNAKFIDQLIASTPINRIPMPIDSNRVGINVNNSFGFSYNVNVECDI
jgi:5-formyltetrahydrofolate cyclo-ligase